MSENQLTNEQLLNVCAKIDEELSRINQNETDREVIREHLRIIQEQAEYALRDELCWFD